VFEGRSDIDPETGHPIDSDGRLQTASDRAWQLLTDPDYRPISEWITLHLEAKAAAGMAPPTVISRRKALEQFAGWLGKLDDVRKVGRRQAVRYIDERITPLAREHSTKLAEIMHLSAFFGWVRDRAPLESNPFHALTKQIPKPARGEDPKRRAWLPAELKALLSAEFPHPIMSAAVLLGKV
jgi:site-specific recombinase XerD